MLMDAGDIAMGADLSTTQFVEQVRHEVRRLANLPPNWDAQGAKTIDPGILRAAEAMIADLPAHTSWAPAVVPMAKGNLQFEWHDGPRTLELEVETPSLIHYLKWHPEEGVEEEGVYNIGDSARSDALVRWFHKATLNV